MVPGAARLLQAAAPRDLRRVAQDLHRQGAEIHSAHPRPRGHGERLTGRLKRGETHRGESGSDDGLSECGIHVRFLLASPPRWRWQATFARFRDGESGMRPVDAVTQARKAARIVMVVEYPGPVRP
ncbi:hypothetical protein Lal_00044872 [Lupinus albus]|nr:hypothetical protein Lal_00044872 [Lupinus albus]